MYIPKPKSRAQEINESIMQNTLGIYHLRCVGKSEDAKPIYSYVLSLVKEQRVSIEERVLAFYRHCQSILQDGETLRCEHKYFRLETARAVLIYGIEFWRKCADRRAYLCEGKVETELLRRMGCEQAASVFRKYSIYPKALLADAAQQPGDCPGDGYAALAQHLQKNPSLAKEMAKR